MAKIGAVYTIPCFYIASTAKKNGVLSASSNLCRDQLELSRYANYLIANVNILERQLCSCAHFCNHNRTYHLPATHDTEPY